jgi:hypothetical protein
MFFTICLFICCQFWPRCLTVVGYFGLVWQLRFWAAIFFRPRQAKFVNMLAKGRSSNKHIEHTNSLAYSNFKGCQDVYGCGHHLRGLLASLPHLLHLHLSPQRGCHHALHPTRLLGNHTFYKNVQLWQPCKLLSVSREHYNSIKQI